MLLGDISLTNIKTACYDSIETGRNCIMTYRSDECIEMKTKSEKWRYLEYLSFINIYLIRQASEEPLVQEMQTLEPAYTKNSVFSNGAGRPQDATLTTPVELLLEGTDIYSEVSATLSFSRLDDNSRIAFRIVKCGGI